MALATGTLHAAALLAAIMAAGLFCTFSVVVMRGLDAAPPQATIRAMQHINAGIRTPVFDFMFFGALLLSLLLAAADPDEPGGGPHLGRVFGALDRVEPPP